MSGLSLVPTYLFARFALLYFSRFPLEIQGRLRLSQRSLSLSFSLYSGELERGRDNLVSSGHPGFLPCSKLRRGRRRVDEPVQCIRNERSRLGVVQRRFDKSIDTEIKRKSEKMKSD